MTTSPIVPIAAVGGLLAVLVAQLRRVHSPRRARLWAATTWWVAFGPLVLLWYVAVGSLPVDGPLFVLVAAAAVVGVFGIAAGLAVVLFEACSRVLAKSLVQAAGATPSDASGFAGQLARGRLGGLRDRPAISLALAATLGTFDHRQ